MAATNKMRHFAPLSTLLLLGLTRGNCARPGLIAEEVTVAVWSSDLERFPVCEALTEFKLLVPVGGYPRPKDSGIPEIIEGCRVRNVFWGTYRVRGRFRHRLTNSFSGVCKVQGSRPVCLVTFDNGDVFNRVVGIKLSDPHRLLRGSPWLAISPVHDQAAMLVTFDSEGRAEFAARPDELVTLTVISDGDLIGSVPLDLRGSGALFTIVIAEGSIKVTTGIQ